jgi:hypothetical protein
MNTIKIVSDGTPENTLVLDSEGKPIHGVTAVHILIVPNEPVTALLKICDVSLDVVLNVDDIIKVKDDTFNGSAVRTDE